MSQQPSGNYPAGWYVDPLAGDPDLLRYWDGRAWTERTARVGSVTPTAATAAPPAPAPPASRSRSWLGPVKWGAVGAFVLVVVVVAVALMRGQEVREVDPRTGRIIFATAGDAAVPADEVAERIEGEQDDIAERVERLEERAQVAADPTIAGTADISGIWTGVDGLTYTIDQFGDQFVLQEHSPFGISAYGEGVVVGDEVFLTFTAFDGTVGEASMVFDGDDELDGSFTNYTWGTTFATLVRR